MYGGIDKHTSEENNGGFSMKFQNSLALLRPFPANLYIAVQSFMYLVYINVTIPYISTYVYSIYTPYIYIYTFIELYIFPYIDTYMVFSIYVYMQIRVFLQLSINVCMHICAYKSVCVYICMYSIPIFVTRRRCRWQEEGQYSTRNFSSGRKGFEFQ